MIDAMLAIMFTEAKAVLHDAPQGIEERAARAMRFTKHHWMCLDETKQFQAAVAALMDSYGEGTPERLRLEAECAAIRRLNAILAAAQEGLSVESLIAGVPEPDEALQPVGLMKIWRAVP